MLNRQTDRLKSRHAEFISASNPQTHVGKILKRVQDDVKKKSSFLRSAFTLAEVLIVIAIIGTIAQMTIPTLMNNVAKQQEVTSLKKAYLSLTNGFKLIMADEGVMEIGSTSLFDGVTAFEDAGRQNQIDAIIKKYFRTIKTCKSGDASCSINDYRDLARNNIGAAFNNEYNFYTADGMVFRFTLETTCQADNSKTGKVKANCGNIWLDVNGAKKPNQTGRDYFLFWLAQDGNVYPAGGQDFAKFTSGDNWQTTDAGNAGYWFVSHSPCTSTAATMWSGSTCAGRIIEESWQMNY